MKHLLLGCLLVIATQVFAQQKSILFLGNSYTATSNLPGTLYNLAAAGGDTIYYESNTPGGHTLQDHSTNSTSLNKIASRNWDFVVLQEQSQKPSFPPAQVAAETYPYAEILVDSIKSNYECTEPVFFMTWGRRDGDQQNCQFYPPLCTFEGMNARLRESYLEMGADNNATVAPCGAAWQQMKLQNNTFWNGLYSGDGSHPSAWGTYLNACVFYATIFRQSPVGIPYYANIGEQDASDLQQLAEDMVLDSLSNWYIGHQDVVSNANFSYAGGLTVDFNSSPENVTSHEWDFGDGTTSSEANFQHTYSMSNTYTVTHIATSDCGSDTAIFQVTVDPLTTSVSDENNLNRIEVIIQQQQLRVNNTSDRKLSVSVIDQLGKLLVAETVQSRSTSSLNPHLVNGLYFIVLDDGNKRSTRKVVLTQ